MSSTGSKGRSKVAQKPNGFTEMESLVKEIFEGQDMSYHEWLHEQHQAFILEFSLKNKGSIASLAKKE
ncbi:hypothetical protein [Metasolibacillus sp.]|uniref:hypothetical protein n=1 Tax=Metasolibacillus sp. TaxID=2703680 RepID=UPI0025F3DAF7|nr:hypothetical protein [Metasolibacillus sp.]MCT6922802.1 hypothetical protein [Metasolibacillus sp.]MCT6938859.1 hypothetical protein [Metasolibacillus sp.]